MPRNTDGLKRSAGPGRPKGRRNTVPGSFKASIRGLYEKLAKEEPALFEAAIRRDLSNRRGTAAFHHVQLAAFYLDGKPKDRIEHSGEVGGGIPTIVNVFTDTDHTDQ